MKNMPKGTDIAHLQCPYCAGKVLVFQTAVLPAEFYAGCDTEGCFARGPIAHDRSEAIRKFKVLINRLNYGWVPGEM